MRNTLKNGQLQKFEYTLELIWKTLKSFLKEEKGIITQGSKDTFREIAPFLGLAHEYEDFIMNNVYPRLKGHLDLLITLVNKF